MTAEALTGQYMVDGSMHTTQVVGHSNRGWIYSNGYSLDDRSIGLSAWSRPISSRVASPGQAALDAVAASIDAVAFELACSSHAELSKDARWLMQLLPSRYNMALQSPCSRLR